MSFISRIGLSFVSLLVVGCSDASISESFLNERALCFAESKRYSIELQKRAIPDFLIDSLSRYNGERFTIGDSLDSSSICLSCVQMLGCIINRQLSFILEGNSEYLVVYKEGWIGLHDVVEYFVLDGAWRHWRCTSAQEIVDVQTLMDVLRNGHE